jgi:hypothetical protein
MGYIEGNKPCTFAEGNNTRHLELVPVAVKGTEGREVSCDW